MTISDTAERVPHAIYTRLAETGVLPPHDELATSLDLPPAVTTSSPPSM